MVNKSNLKVDYSLAEIESNEEALKGIKYLNVIVSNKLTYPSYHTILSLYGSKEDLLNEVNILKKEFDKVYNNLLNELKN